MRSEVVGNHPKAGRILAESWGIFRRQRTILNVALGAWLIGLFSLAVLHLAGYHFPTFSWPPVPPVPPAHQGLLIVTQIVLGLVAGPLAMAGVMRSLLSLIEDRPVSLGKFFRWAVGGFKRALWLFLSSLLLALPFLLVGGVATVVAVMPYLIVLAHAVAVWAKVLAGVVAVLLWLLLLIFGIWLSGVLTFIPAVGFTDPELGALKAATRAIGLAWRHRWVMVGLGLRLSVLLFLAYAVLILLGLVPILGTPLGLFVVQLPALLGYLALLVFYRGWGGGEDETA